MIHSDNKKISCVSARNWTYDLVRHLCDIIDPTQRVLAKTAQSYLRLTIGRDPSGIVSGYAFNKQPEGFEALYQACLEPERLFYKVYQSRYRPSESPAWPNQHWWKPEVWAFHEDALKQTPQQLKRSSSSPVEEEEERPKKLIKSF